MHNGVIMPSEVRYLVDTGATYPVVRFTGVLDQPSVPAIRAALLELLAGQPVAVVVDVRELRVSDDAAVSVFGDLARETADWPAAQMALCVPETEAMWRTTGLPAWPTPADAFAELGEPNATLRQSLDLEPIVGSARRSRELVSDACGNWHLPALAGPASIVVTEMVNNVVAHARTAMTVLLGLHDDAVAVAVRDYSTTVPRFAGPVAPTSQGGRGLLLIDSVAERWGSLALDGGKVVWAIVQGDNEPARPAGDHLGGTGMADPARG